MAGILCGATFPVDTVFKDAATIFSCIAVDAFEGIAGNSQDAFRVGGRDPPLINDGLLQKRHGEKKQLGAGLLVDEGKENVGVTGFVQGAEAHQVFAP